MKDIRKQMRASNLRDHAGTDQHAHAMMLLNREKSKAQGLTVSSYAPIARALHRLSDEERARLRRKFDITYFVATEKLSFGGSGRSSPVQDWGFQGAHPLYKAGGGGGGGGVQGTHPLYKVGGFRALIPCTRLGGFSLASQPCVFFGKGWREKNVWRL